MKHRTLALIATGIVTAAIAAAAAFATSAPANGAGSPTPPSVRSTITGW